jgi:hypothetical protein
MLEIFQDALAIYDMTSAVLTVSSDSNVLKHSIVISWSCSDVE